MSFIKDAGYYDAKVVEAEFGESTKGTPYIYLRFEDLDTGDQIGSWNYLSEKAFEYTDAMLREVFEFDGDYNSAIEQMVGKEANINVKIQEGNDGKDRANVAFINKAGGAKKTPIANQDDFLANLTQRSAVLSGKPAVKKDPF